MENTLDFGLVYLDLLFFAGGGGSFPALSTPSFLAFESWVGVACRLEWEVSGHPRRHVKARGALLGRQQLHWAHPALGVKLEAPDQDQFQSQQHVGAYPSRPGGAALN